MIKLADTLAPLADFPAAYAKDIEFDDGKENPATVNIKGAKGDRGDSGVTTPINGFFTMYVDEDGNLWVLSEDDLTNTFEYDEATGNLYFVQEV